MTDCPEKIYNVSMGQLSIARYYGGCKFNGKYYVYNHFEDSLTREDVFKKTVSKSEIKEQSQ